MKMFKNFSLDSRVKCTVFGFAVILAIFSNIEPTESFMTTTSIFSFVLSAVNTGMLLKLCESKEKENK